MAMVYNEGQKLFVSVSRELPLLIASQCVTCLFDTNHEITRLAWVFLQTSFYFHKLRHLNWICA